MSRRVVVRTRFEAFLHFVARRWDRPVDVCVDTAQDIFDSFGCATWSDETFLRMLMFR